MIVSELIKELQSYDPELVVKVEDGQDPSGPEPIKSVRAEVIDGEFCVFLEAWFPDGSR